MAMSVLDSDLTKLLIEELKQNPKAKKHYSWSRDILRRKSKLVVPLNSTLRDTISQWLHCSGTGGHAERDATHQRVKKIFYWKEMIKDIQQYIP